MTDVHDLEDARAIAAKFGLENIESATRIGEGLIARNSAVQSSTGQRFVLRSYDLQRSLELGYTRSRFEFEITVLRFLDGQTSLDTPSPLRAEDGKFYHVERGRFYVLYRLIDGQTLKQSDLSICAAGEAGRGLREIVDVGATFRPNAPTESGGLTYIREIVSTLMKRAEIGGDERLSKLAVYANDFSWANALENSPRGIVHGDYFYDNTLWSSAGEMSGVIDFGDSFFGAALHDIAVGAMEFAVTSEERVELELMEAFLRPFEDWFARSSIDIDLFVAVLRLNCVRYATHLTSLGLETGMSRDEALDASYNPYIDRFHHFADRGSLDSLSTLFPDTSYSRKST